MEGSQLTPQPASTDPWSKPGTPAEHEHELHCAASHASNLILTTLEVQYRRSFFHDVSKIGKRLFSSKTDAPVVSQGGNVE